MKYALLFFDGKCVVYEASERIPVALSEADKDFLRCDPNWINPKLVTDKRPATPA